MGKDLREEPIHGVDLTVNWARILGKDLHSEVPALYESILEKVVAGCILQAQPVSCLGQTHKIRQQRQEIPSQPQIRPPEGPKKII